MIVISEYLQWPIMAQACKVCITYARASMSPPPTCEKPKKFEFGQESCKLHWHAAASHKLRIATNQINIQKEMRDVFKSRASRNSFFLVDLTLGHAAHEA